MSRTESITRVLAVTVAEYLGWSDEDLLILANGEDLVGLRHSCEPIARQLEAGQRGVVEDFFLTEELLEKCSEQEVVEALKRALLVIQPLQV